MPTGVYPRLDKHKIILRNNALKRGIPWNKGLHIKPNNALDVYKEKYGAWNKGRKIKKQKKLLSKEQRGLKISLRQLGKKRKPFSEEWKKKIGEASRGRIPWNKGKHLSKEHRIKIGEARKGEKNNLWKHGLSKTKEYKRKYNRITQFKRRAFGCRLSVKIIQMVYEDNIKKYGTLTCYLCEKPIDFGKDTIDHKLPISRGGGNTYDNLAVACGSCNFKKHTKTYEEYMGSSCHMESKSALTALVKPPAEPLQ